MKDIDYIKRHKTETELFPNQTYADVFFKFGVTSNSLNLCAKMAMRKVENKITETVAHLQYVEQAKKHIDKFLYSDREEYLLSIDPTTYHSDRATAFNMAVLASKSHIDEMALINIPPSERLGVTYSKPTPGFILYDQNGKVTHVSPSERERRTERRNDVESEPQPPVTKKHNKIKKIWKHKWEILKALWTLKFSKDKTVRVTIATRRSICMSNACQKLDRYGTATDTIWKGKPACGVCGCNVLLKASYLPGECALKEVDQEPLWKAFVTSDKALI